MFVALKVKERTRVTSIASQWDEAEEILREGAAAGELVCPGCEQLLWLRVPHRRRRHFAHRSLADCPLEHQSVEVLEAKAQLYRWLETKYPGQVNLEVPLGAPGRAPTADLVVEPAPGRTFAYWVFDRPQRHREEFLSGGAFKGVALHFVHTGSALHQEAGDLLLSASQRDFVVSSEFDACAGWPGFGHLHFLRTEDSTLCIYRGLYCVHRPSVYRAPVLRTGPLAAALISPKTGELVLPEDVATREAWRQKQRSPIAPLPRPAPAPEPAPVEVASEPVAARAEEPPLPNFDGPFRCEVCGTMTKKWSEATPALGTCVCRDCVQARGKARSAPNPPGAFQACQTKEARG